MIDFFGTGAYAKLADLEAFRDETSSEIARLNRDISSKVTDSEEVAKEAARNAVAAEERVRELEIQFHTALTQLKEFSKAAEAQLKTVEDQRGQLQAAADKLNTELENTRRVYDETLSAKSEVDAAKANIHSDIEEINKALEKSVTLPESVDRVSHILQDSEDLYTKIGDLLSHAAARKTEIDELRDKILGKDIEVDGSNVHVDGIKDKLEKGYAEIEARVRNLESEVRSVVEAVKLDHDKELATQTQIFEELISRSNARVTAVDNELKNLLPGAMAAGLSAAFEKKKNDETESLNKSEKKFQRAIYALAGVSGIPILVDLYLLFGEKVGIAKVIQDTPNLLLAIIPIYLPALWIAFSLNKKNNLSKRLIEEYTHKEVLGKTFSGISNQINTLHGDDETKDELRTRLLFNLLHVSAENPGKLITDYNKSDHPLLSILDNSKRLSDSMESLAKIPGLEMITKSLVARSKRRLEEAAEATKSGLTINEVLRSHGSSAAKPVSEPE